MILEDKRRREEEERQRRAEEERCRREIAERQRKEAEAERLRKAEEELQRKIEEERRRREEEELRRRKEEERQRKAAENKKLYDKAVDLMESAVGLYKIEEAIKIFSDLDDYQDSEQKLTECLYKRANILEDRKQKAEKRRRKFRITRPCCTEF